MSKRRDLSASDAKLGMGCPISRRDFINGVSATAASAMLLPKLGLAEEAAALGQLPPAETGVGAGQFAGLETGGPSETYSPRKTGMRGSHPGSFEQAHQLRDNPTEALNNATAVDDVYDLIVVGAGISGLSAAYFFQKNVGKDAKVLILDNHDDFGGHAKRNEAVVNGKLLVTMGGSSNIEAPAYFNDVAKDLIKDVGIDLEKYVRSNEPGRALYRNLGMRNAYFFDKETWGKDLLLQCGSGRDEGVATFTREFLDKSPLSEKAKADMLRLQDASHPDYFPDLSVDDKLVKLATMSYEDYLLNVIKVDKQVVWFYQHVGDGMFSVGVDQVPALFAYNMHMPGFSGLKLPLPTDGILEGLPGRQHGRQKDDALREQGIHLPDGNATIPRALVRRLIPEAIPGTTFESLGAARVNYAALDRDSQSVRIRLSSTVLHARNEGPKDRETGVAITYSKGNKLYTVRGKACVMAGWNMLIPYLMPDLPADQKAALHYAVKGPLILSTVAIKNWQSFKALGASGISCPSMYHTAMSMQQPLSLGELEYSASPDQPIFIHMQRKMAVPGLSRQDQHRAGRMQLLNTSFETFERHIREQLTRVLGPYGFDAARDIAGITVNRWPHGYAYTYTGLHEPLEWVYTESPNRPCVIARRPFGLISIANSDAAASPHVDAAIWEAHRAVDEVINRRAMPYLAKAFTS